VCECVCVNGHFLCLVCVCVCVALVGLKAIQTKPLISALFHTDKAFDIGRLSHEPYHRSPVIAAILDMSSFSYQAFKTCRPSPRRQANQKINEALSLTTGKHQPRATLVFSLAPPPCPFFSQKEYHDHHRCVQPPVCPASVPLPHIDIWPLQHSVIEITTASQHAHVYE